MWTISDFPAYGMLSGWTTHGKLSCPICRSDTNSFYLPAGRKTCWFDCHRRFLPSNHPLRKNKVNFLKGRSAINEYPPDSLSGEQVYQRIQYCGAPKTVDVGGNGHAKKPNGHGDWHNWHKKSIFWELPYWIDLNVRHNLDMMHIEKNFFDNIIYTIMNVKKRSKDTVKSRVDIAQFCRRPELHIDRHENAPFPIWRLNVKGMDALLYWAKNNVKFPDGYVADLASCVDIPGRQFSGMKSHDCHVFMERLMPFVFAELLPRNVHQALSGIGCFFRDLSSRSLEQSQVQSLKENIVMILCNLEKIFPPSFFDVMEHLPIHLPYEAELGGPVQYRWMYPFERFFQHLKGKAKNKTKPAASIVLAYMIDEVSYFSEHYFPSEISTASRRRLNRYDEGVVPVYLAEVPDIFIALGRPSGKCMEFWISDIDYQSAHSYVLRNCEYFGPLERLFEAQIRYANPDLSDEDVMAKRGTDFHEWVRQYVNHTKNQQNFPYWVLDIVEGPQRKVKSWPMYFTRGYMFHTRGHGAGKKTMNYGVCVRGQHYSEAAVEDDFYGTVETIMELQYPGFLNLKVMLFYCEWYDPTIGKGTRKSPGGIVDVLSTGRYPNYEPFILGSQADQVTYLPYPCTKRPRKIWFTVVKVNPRNRVQGKFKEDELIILQQSTDEGGSESVDEIVIESLVDRSNLNEPIDVEIGDSDASDEFLCNLSTSDDE